MRFYLILLFISLLPTSVLFAQIRIVGKTMNTSGNNLHQVTVNLLTLPDSTRYSQTHSDENGHFSFHIDKEGSYVIKYSYVGFKPLLSRTIHAKKNDYIELIPAQLLEEIHTLDNFNVRAKRPALKQEIDRLVIDVEGSISAEGNNVLELLEKTPGVISDGKGNFSIQGRTGAKIKIDGRDIYISGNQLNNMLKGLQARDIARLELMSSPSAKEDAEGSAGAINIITKKNNRSGWGGDIFLRGGASREPQGSTGGGIHYKTQKINVFTNASWGFEEASASKTIERHFNNKNGSMINRQLQTESMHTKPAKYHSIHTGLLFQPDSNQTIEASLNWIKGNFVTTNDILNQLQQSPSAIFQNQANSKSRFDEGYNNLTFNINYLHKYNRDKHFLKANIDYAPHSNKYDNRVNTNFLNEQSPTKSGRHNIQNLTNTTYAARVDYSLPVSKEQHIELGWKASYLAIDNNTRNDTLTGATWQIDNKASNNFKYSQHVQASYFIYTGKINSFEYQVGLRGEFTAFKADQRTLDQVLKKNRFDLFPNAYTIYHINEFHFIRSSLSSRIERPGDHEVNIFRIYDDYFTYTEGNANLKPEKSNIIELGHGYKNKLFTTASISIGSDIIRYVTRQGESANQLFTRPENIGSFRNYSLGWMYNNQFTNYWSGSHYANVFHNDYSGEIDEQSLSTKGTNWNIHSKHNIQIKWGMQSEVTAYYNSGITTGARKNKQTYGVDIALEKKMFNEKATVKLAAHGIIRNAKTQYTSTFDNIIIYNTLRPDNRKVLLSLNYRFGD
ncbi:outer membrane beta-barrel family protein [Sphingobacterium sp. UT-1RO-CII-1]|uniref:outer membrane beta-barrel family protein n=1 Tax=Sphingobacterium sp. UT-1RO-CII-1 TaxID=2995225 RepID=UPI00227D4DBD|nr:outer membrane beta-barrel family protein [Sphingobacterium sp. UT-1RO-CII-1]MCY4781506.1 outer membrane beta-barrel family protein [Sphingobacterium sp. UT-1RO-CII-1]